LNVWDGNNPTFKLKKTDENGGRADYILGTPVRAVIETKKESNKFDIIPTGKVGTTRKLRPLVMGCKNLDSAFKQIIPYCAMNGAQIAIICNGPQLILFQSSIPGMSPLDSECYVFDGFNQYIEHFSLLWKLMSPEAIDENRAYKELVNYRNPRIPAKASTTIGEPKAYRYRSPFQENLRSVASIIVDNIDDNVSVKKDFYRECYVPMEANNRSLLLSKNIIASRYKRVSDNGITPAKIAAKIDQGKLHLDETFQEGSGSSRPIVVIGDVGVGKTSFFENLFESLNEAQKKLTYYIHINLGENATLSKDVKTYILSNIPHILKDKYDINIYESEFVEDVYKIQVTEFDKSIQGQFKNTDPTEYKKEYISFLAEKTKDTGSHLQECLNHLVKKQNKQIILVVDNADQRTFETQQEAFLIAQELAAARNILVFVALRPSTFYQSKLTGALSGYQNRVLTISPPPADEVIRKRLTFAVRVAEGKTAPAALEGVRLNIASIVSFMKATLRSIKSNSNIQMFLSNITGGNTRSVIELISSFIGSPNVESERIVRIEDETGTYQVPLHEFTKHSLLGEYSYFNPLSSLVAYNLFDITAPDPREHFLGHLLIAYISSPMGIRDNDGFVAADYIIKEMMRVGFTAEQSRLSLRRLSEKRLIETPHGHYREIAVPDNQNPDEFHFRATSIGLYHIRYWAAEFSFLDATSIDTPIFDNAARGLIFEKANSLEISHRYERAVIFKKYLESQWQQADFQLNYYDFSAVLISGNQSFNSVKNFLENGPRVRKYPRRH
jgi:GTPase SAR1 family protein